ncbi:MAG: helix-hairpin-helix domain-containing protein [Bacteroidales bacterium]|nr:helix-hairpin-helix domain-containing protein [Bacteroidales bacterium]
MAFKIINIKNVGLVLFSLFLSVNTLAQKVPTLEDLIEDIAGNTDAEIDYTSLYEDLNHYLNNPLNLNTATQEDLEKLQILNDFQVKSLLDYIKQKGQMLSIYELQLVYGFTLNDITKILPFVTILGIQADARFKIKNALKYGNHQVFLRGQEVLEEQVGYSPISDSALLESPNSRYLGSSYKLYTKYKYNYKNKIYWGFTAEKDAGEEFFAGTNKNGFDFYSAHLQVNDIGIIKTITLGDFQAKFGQGLVLWSDMGLGKTPYVLNIRKKAQGLKKYSSTNENIFMRGAGTTISVKNFDITTFYSNKKIDANIQDSTENDIASVSSFQNTGYHSVPSEIIDKDAIGEQIIGGNITYNHNRFKVGLTGVNYKYSSDLLKDTTPENQFKFQGDENTNIGLDYKFGFGDFSFFGEEAISANGGKAFLNGILVNLAPQVSFSAMHRHYDKNYQANFANAFAEASGSSNESGLYFGLELHPIKHWQVTAYFDTYQFPWIKTGIDAPSNGYDWFIQTDYAPARNLSMYLRLKNEEKLVNKNADSGIDELTNQNNFKIRFHISYRINDQISLKNRVETATFKEGSEKPDYGYMIYQDIFYDFANIPLSFNMRFAVFETDSYDARIYAYESDILYAFSIPAYYSKGSRTYFNLKYSLGDYMDIWLRYAQTYYSDTNEISSGLTQINGNTKSEIKVQLRIRL